jgi:single-strand DNA-binding protein
MSINTMIFTGNCGADMEIRHTPSGVAIGTVNVPVKQGWGDNEKTSWVTCKMFKERAEKLAPYLKKGTPVTVQGEFVLEQWEKDGVTRSKPVCIVNNVQLGKSDRPAQAQVVAQPAQQAISDDEIPF